jgi:hypothetical protein
MTIVSKSTPLALVASPTYQHDGIAPDAIALMSRCQPLQDADVDVGIKCVCLALSTLGAAQLPCLFMH